MIGRSTVLAMSMAALSPTAMSFGEAGYEVQWTRLLGTTAYEVGYGVAVDTVGNPYIVGRTHGALGGASAGISDAFVAGYDSAGTQSWVRQFGTTASEIGRGIAADTTGNLFIAGDTLGTLGGANAGGNDAYVAQYSTGGTAGWIRQVGTSAVDMGVGVATDAAGNIFITGYTKGAMGGPNAGREDAFVIKYDPAGTLAWTRQLGTTQDDDAYAVATDAAGNIFVTGRTLGSLDGTNAGANDAFVAKYDAAGTLAWTRQLGTSLDEYSLGVATDLSGNLFITGYTAGSLDGINAGSHDAFLAKYDAAGNLAWTRQLGTSAGDYAQGVATDAHGNVFITGYTGGTLGGASAGGDDVFVAKYDTQGVWAWTVQFGSDAIDRGFGIAIDAAGNPFIAGYTTGSLGGAAVGGGDAFLAKLLAPQVQELLGDVNLDGAVNALDISPFVSRLTTGDYQVEADCNKDGLVNALDISPFITILTGGGGATAVPEPATVGLVVLGGLVLRQRR